MTDDTQTARTAFSLLPEYRCLSHLQLSTDQVKTLDTHLHDQTPFKDVRYEDADHSALSFHLLDPNRWLSVPQLQAEFRRYIAGDYQPFRVPEPAELQAELELLVGLGAAEVRTPQG